MRLASTTKSCNAGTDAALFAELESAVQRQAPILLWIYTPHWAPIKYEGEWVDFPRYTDECYKDPKWGMNPDKAYDCGKPRGWIKKVGWKGGEEKWPNAYQAVRNFRITNQEMGAMVGPGGPRRQERRRGGGGLDGEKQGPLDGLDAIVRPSAGPLSEPAARAAVRRPAHSRRIVASP